MITPFTKEVAVFEPVQKGTKPVQMFRCSDGQEFDDETKANRHEEEVEKENKKKQAWAALEKLENRESCELFDSLLGCSGDYRSTLVICPIISYRFHCLRTRQLPARQPRTTA